MAAEVIKLYQDENVEPLQNMTKYAAIDYKLLASALADEMERRQKAEQAQKKAAKAKMLLRLLHYHKFLKLHSVCRFAEMD